MSVSITKAQDHSDDQLRVIAVFAHPDDGDVKMGGTAALMAEHGHAVKFLSLTNGDAGHHEEGGGALAKRRRAEAKEAAKRFGIDEYKVLDNHDGELMPELHIRNQVIREIREWNADVVIGLRPNDYHPDHRYAGILMQDAAYMVVVPNVAPDTPPLKKNPVFLYMNDRFEKPNPFSHDIVVGIDKVIDKKVNALDAHESQMYEWLPWVSGDLDQVPEGEKERKEWLGKRWTSRELSQEQQQGLEKWYGSDKANSFDYAESFEVCEYGHQPSDEELKTIFPMLGGNK
ncbi:PIG-L deacetylase family protein [Fodinibius sp. Rm-B-1B1-1]|uniref:PIG-L deacetylase family protein n=1 Tax=Fodinibius alkaliphilus TaxID=3140241 RepID=UPI003159A6D4